MKKLPRSRTTQPKQRRRTPARPRSSRLEELSRQFAQFRSAHRRGTRIPDTLRSAALLALEQGVTMSELKRDCGVLWSQVVAWRSGPEHKSTDGRSEHDSQVRSFAVVDSAVDTRGGPETASIGRELELRFGDWLVKVRLAEPSTSEGGQACSR